MKKSENNVMFVSRTLYDHIQFDDNKRVESYYIARKNMYGVCAFDIARVLNIPYSKILHILDDFPPVSFIHKICAGQLKYRELVHVGHMKHMMSSPKISSEMKDSVAMIKKSLQEHNKIVYKFCI